MKPFNQDPAHALFKCQTMIADGEVAYACATTLTPPTILLQQMTKCKMGVEAIEAVRANETALDSTIQGHFIRSDDISSIFVHQPPIVVVVS